MASIKHSCAAALTAVLVLTGGCGGTVSVKQNFDRSLAESGEHLTYIVRSVSATTAAASPAFLALVRAKLDAELSERNMLATDGMANGLEISVNKFRMRGEVTRQFFLLSGADTVATTVTVKAPSGATLGEAEVSYSNTTYVCKEDCMALQVARRIVAFLAGAEQ